MSEVVNNLKEFSRSFTPLSEVLISFSMGVLLSPISFGLFWFLLFLIIYEVIYYCLVHKAFWDSNTRACVVIYSILGWIVGRSVRGAVIVDCECEDPEDEVGWYWRKWA